MLMMTCFCPDTYNISTYSQSTHSTHSLFNTTLSFILFTLFFLSNDALADHTQSLLPRADLDKIKHQYSADVSQRFNAWDRLLINSQNKTTIEKLLLVNQFFNKMQWVEDRKLWKKRDYWATPIETLIRNAGDCEDFSIAKYFTLRALNVPTQRLKITYVHMLNYDQPHMVLAYYKTPESDPLILDNVNKEISPYSHRNDLQIKFSFNGEGLWLANSASHQPIDDSGKILLWADLIKRMKNESI